MGPSPWRCVDISVWYIRTYSLSDIPPPRPKIFSISCRCFLGKFVKIICWPPPAENPRSAPAIDSVPILVSCSVNVAFLRTKYRDCFLAVRWWTLDNLWMFYPPLEADVMRYVVHADTESSFLDGSFHSVYLWPRRFLCLFTFAVLVTFLPLCVKEKSHEVLWVVSQSVSAQVLLRTSGYLDTRLLAPNEWILLPDKLKFEKNVWKLLIYYQFWMFVKLVNISLASWFSSGEVKFGTSRPDGQVTLRWFFPKFTLCYQYQICYVFIAWRFFYCKILTMLNEDSLWSRSM